MLRIKSLNFKNKVGVFREKKLFKFQETSQNKMLRIDSLN